MTEVGRTRALTLGVAAGLLLFLACWTATTPAGGAPDERAHHIKAIAAGHGELRGRPSRTAVTPMRQRELAPRSTRVFRIHTHAIDATFGCGRRHPGRPASCLKRGHAHGQINRSTYVATYPPFAYVPAGLVGRVSSDPIRSLLLERLVFASVAGALLVGAAIALGVGRRAHPFALLGLFFATTPMVLFLAGSLNVSGLHIVAVLALGAALLRATRRNPPPTRGTWALAAVAGVVAVLTRSEGALWVASALVVFWFMRPTATGSPTRPPRSLFAVLGLAVVALGGWQLSAGEGPGFGLSGTGTAVRDIAAHLRLVNQVPGVFGWLDTTLPNVTYAGWYVAAALFGVIAIVVATWRQRVALLLGPVVAVAAGVVFQAVLLGPQALTGQLIQARYVMPGLLLAPLVGGEVLDRRFSSPPRWLVGGAVTLLALFDAGALYVHSRRNAVGVRGARWFLAHPRWSPPFGWWVWMAVGAAAVLVVVAGAVISEPRRESR